MRLLGIIILILAANLQVFAQPIDSVDVPYGTIRIKKIGATKKTSSVRTLNPVPTLSENDFIRCLGVICSYNTYNSLTLGYQFYEFGFIELGYLRSRPNKFPTDIGMKIEARFSSDTYGLNLYMSHDLVTRNRHNHRLLSAGVGIITYSYDANLAVAIRPNIALHIPRCAISNFDFFYGVNLFLDKSPITGIFSSVATITYRIPFY